jgi:hypothetical protein
MAITLTDTQRAALTQAVYTLVQQQGFGALVDFLFLPNAQQKAALRAAVQAQRSQLATVLAALPAQHAAETAGFQAQVTDLDSLLNSTTI